MNAGDVVGRASSRSPGSRSTTGVIAIVLFVGGIVAVVVGMVMLFSAVIGGARDDGARRDSVVEVAVPGSDVVDLDGGPYVALALGEGLVTARFDPVTDRVVAVRGPFADPVIEVRDPTGQALELRPPRVDTLEDRPGTDAASLVEFTVRVPGSHTIEIEHAAGSTGGPVTSVVLRGSGGLDALGIGRFVPGFVLTFLGGFAVIVGVLLGVVSLVRRTT